MDKSGRIFNLGPFSLLKQCNEDPNIKEEPGKYHYCMVNNIPVSFHAADVRNFFAEFIASGKFDLFHFRHRPQIIKSTEQEVKIISTEEDECDNKFKIPESREPNNVQESANVKKLCCPVRFTEESTACEFIKKYNKKMWIDKKGNDVNLKCLISLVKLSAEDLVNFKSKEFHPPSFMPKGNIGCSNDHFLQLIKECRLPPSLIKKLGLEFAPLRRYRKYSKVPYNYGTGVAILLEYEEEEEVKTASGHTISFDYTPRKRKIPLEEEISDNDSNADDDEDRCEEWERHQALHDEVTSHGGVFSQSKERLLEERIELKWEKGGSGLVFYTDEGGFWDPQKGDFDERTTDDWDVDMEGYYVEGGGDKDARDLLEMRQSERFQQGLEHISLFSRPENRSRHRRAKSSSPTPSISGKIGEFEKYTKGIGRKLMEKQGWTDGSGIGKSKIGMVDALENDGNRPRDRSGIGYYGEKLVLSTNKKKKKKFNDYSIDSDSRISIGTVFDKPKDLDIQEPLLRRNAPTFVKRYDKPTTSVSKLVSKCPKIENFIRM